LVIRLCRHFFRQYLDEGLLPDIEMRCAVFLLIQALATSCEMSVEEKAMVNLVRKEGPEKGNCAEVLDRIAEY